MHQPAHIGGFAPLVEALTVLFCVVDDIYQNVNPNGRCYESLKKLSDSEVITLALIQQLSPTFSPGWSASPLPPCNANRGQDHRLHLRFSGQPEVGRPQWRIKDLWA
jgi:hypothetical protein